MVTRPPPPPSRVSSSAMAPSIADQLKAMSGQLYALAEAVEFKVDGKKPNWKHDDD